MSSKEQTSASGNSTITESDDCIISLNLERTFNISQFIKEYRDQPDDVIKRIDAFACDLDTKIHIDANDTRYKDIYDKAELVVKRLCEKLREKKINYENVYLRRTGSIKSGMKVALPHECAFLLFLEPELVMNGSSDSNLFILQLHQDASAIVNTSFYELTSGFFTKLKIHGVTKHRAGICLVMEYTYLEECEQYSVGVTVDIVPVCQATPNGQTKCDFTQLAKQYLPRTIIEYIENRLIYRLVDRDQIDTGEIENNIIKDLPDDIKRGFRLAKYLTQLCVYDHMEISFESEMKREPELACRLIGYKS